MRREFARRTALLALAQVLGRAGALVMAVVLVRIMQPDEWASLALLVSVYLVAQQIGGFNIFQGLFYFYVPAVPRDRRGVAAQSTVLMAAAGLVLALAIVGFGPWIAGDRFGVAGLFPILALAVALETPSLGGQHLLLAAERPRAASLFTGAFSLLSVVAIVGPVLAGHGLPGAMYGLVAYAGVRLIVYLIVLGAVTPAGPAALSLAAARSQFLYALPLGLAIGAAALNRQLGKWLVAWLAPGDFGAYAVAANEIPVLAVVPAAASAVLASRIVEAFHRRDRERARAYWLAATGRVTPMVVGVTVAVVLLARPLVEILFTSDYLVASLPLQIHTLIMLHRVAEYGGMLRAAGDTRSLWFSSLVLLAANALLGLPLVRVFGMEGAALAALGANVIAWFYILGRIARVLGVGIRAAFPWITWTRSLLAAVIAAAAAWLISSSMPDTAWLQMLLRAGVYVAFLVLLLRWLRVRQSLREMPEDEG